MLPMTDPWDERYIYLHEWLKFMIHVGKYTIHGFLGLCYWQVLSDFLGTNSHIPFISTSSNSKLDDCNDVQ